MDHRNRDGRGGEHITILARRASGSTFFTFTNVHASELFAVILTNAANTTGVSGGQVVASVLTDTDGDGMPDGWENDHGLDPAQPADAALDQDGDGLNNRDEWLAGTVPDDPTSVLRVERILCHDDTVTIEFQALAGRTYAVQWKSTLCETHWSTLSSIVARAQNHLESIPDILPHIGQRFYRIITPSVE